VTSHERPIITGIALESGDTPDHRDGTGGNPIRIGIASTGTMFVDASVANSAMDHHLGSILKMAQELGVELPAEEIVFRSGQVFFEGGHPAEVRLSLSCRTDDGPWHTWQRTRTRNGHESDRGPEIIQHLSVAPLGQIEPLGHDPLAEADRGRCHITAVGMPYSGALGGVAIAITWDLRDNARAAKLTAGTAPDTDFMRVPQGLLVATTHVRSGRIETVERAFPAKDTFPIDPDMALWTVVPSEGTSLVLPFADMSGVTVATVRGQAHLVLSGGLLMSYLTTWALWGARPDPAGRFLVSTEEVASLRGWSRRSTGRSEGGATYGKPMSEFRGHVRMLEGYGIKATSEIKARSLEPMIQFYEQRSGGTYYRHAPILIDTILTQAGRQEPGGFAQVPMRALRLGARDGAAVYGLSAFWRRGAAADWRGSLLELASAVGCYSANEARKRGRSYWLNLAGDLGRIVRDGGFGELHVGGSDPGPDAPCTLTPSAELEGAYVRLHEARERARARTEAAEHEAAVRRKLPAPKRRGRRSQPP
jgi:hypothetical protein